ncbi:ATPase family AAA domain-containing protein 3 [Trichinella britovi]|uniref:ATPase family AAA domain-containing protein 3 n=1 Tax=Trichinella britovi TaxID=45882 RepID=A0A0V1CSV4_TRIBR|nr:ATPase family AAA domain-containing protein 3 [Trichinella britovi]
MFELFGIKPTVESPPSDGASSSPPSPPENGQKPPDKSRMAYSFDSAALERAAKAARELEQSKNAKEALELARLQEQTRQMELQQRIKEFEALAEKNKVEQRRVSEEEKRRTLSEESKQFKLKAEYQDQLARKRFADEQALRRREQEEALRRQEESVQKQELMRRRTIEEELKLKHQYDVQRVEQEARARALVERENREIYLEQLRVREKERRTTVLEAITTGGKMIGSGLSSFFSDLGTMMNTAAGLTLLAVGLYTAKRATSVAARYAEARLARPSLVRDTSRLGVADFVREPLRSVAKMFRRPGDPLAGVILEPSLERRLRDVAITTKNTKRNRGLYRNFLFYGPPGTGKTLFAKRLASHSGMHYAVMTGGDVAPLGRHAVTEIHKLFDWASTSRRGLILFVDEADAFLRRRDAASEHTRAAFNAFLYRTGDQSSHFSLVLATNRPEQFDWAVNDRLDEVIEFSLPSLDQCRRLLLLYFHRYIAEPAISRQVLPLMVGRLKLADFDWVEKCNAVATNLVGMSGREIAKMVVAWQAAAYASEDGCLTEQMIDELTEHAVRQHSQKAAWLAMEADSTAGDKYTQSHPRFSNCEDYPSKYRELLKERGDDETLTNYDERYLSQLKKKIKFHQRILALTNNYFKKTPLQMFNEICDVARNVISVEITYDNNPTEVPEFNLAKCVCCKVVWNDRLVRGFGINQKYAKIDAAQKALVKLFNVDPNVVISMISNTLRQEITGLPPKEALIKLCSLRAIKFSLKYNSGLDPNVGTAKLVCGLDTFEATGTKEFAITSLCEKALEDVFEIRLYKGVSDGN